MSIVPDVQTGGVPNAKLVGFIKNVGQWPTDVLYLARQHGADVWITRDGAVIDEYTVDHIKGERSGVVTSERFVATYARMQQSAFKQCATAAFFKGQDPSAWVVAPVYSSVMVANVYPGIDVTYGTNEHGMVTRFITVRDGADASAVRLDRQGLAKGNDVVADVSPTTLFVFGTYFGGEDVDLVAGVETLTTGDVVVSGYSMAIEFPGGTGGYISPVKGGGDGYLARFDRELTRVKAYAFIGGNGNDQIRTMTRDAVNNIYVAGQTTSTNFPTTSGVTGKLYKSGNDAFVAKLDSTLTKLIVGFYHGGNKEDYARAVAVDKNFLIYVAGGTTSTTSFPVTFPATVRIALPTVPVTFRDEPGGGTNVGQTDGFVASFSPNGSIQQSRFFGRENVEYFTAMAVDASSSVYLTGSTTSGNFETAPTAGIFASGRVPYDRTFNGGLTDAFVVKLNNELALAKTDDGTYSTFFGGNGEEEGRGLFVDVLGRAHVVGVTTSRNLETVGSLFSQPFGDFDIFMAVFSDDGRDLSSATYYGGTGRDDVFGVEQYLNTTTAVIYGTTRSFDFPIIGEGANGSRSGTTDGYIALINTSTNKFATLIGGNGNDTVRSVAPDNLGDVYFAETTTSTDAVTHDSAYAKTGSGHTGYVAKLAFGVLELISPSGGEAWCTGSNKTITWSSLGFADTVKFRIQWVVEGANNWTDVVASTIGRNYQWRIPALGNGRYLLRVMSSRGHVSQLLTPFFISNPPTIVTQPQNAGACMGQAVTLSIEADGALLKYQWRKGGVAIAGATASVLVIPSVDATSIAQYACVVTGACSPSITSNIVGVFVASATAITTQPIGTTVEEGKTFTLTVVASGSNLEYQWLKDGMAISGATTPEYKMMSCVMADAGLYSCSVKGGCGTAVSSNVAIVVTPSTSVSEDVSSSASWLGLVSPVPASDQVVIRIELIHPVHVVARMIDTEGRIVATIDVGTIASGPMDILIPVNNLASGVYAIEIRAGDLIGRVMSVVR